MLVTLDTPYADTNAGELSLALGAPEQPALHVLDLTGPGGVRLRLRLLGASHQVVLRYPAAGGSTRPEAPARPGTPARTGELIETVACLPGQRPELPAEWTDEAAGYRFTARVLRLDPAGLASRTARLRRDLAADPYALIGVFPGLAPGDADAVTALRVRQVGGGTGWRTWHAYPQTGELVETETVVTVA